MHTKEEAFNPEEKGILSLSRKKRHGQKEFHLHPEKVVFDNEIKFFIHIGFLTKLERVNR